MSSTSSASVASDGESYTSTHDYSLAGSGSTTLSYTTPVTAPGGSATVKLSNGLLLTAVTSSATIQVSKTFFRCVRS